MNEKCHISAQKLSMTNLSSFRPEENAGLGNRLPIFQPNRDKTTNTSFHTFITSIVQMTSTQRDLEPSGSKLFSSTGGLTANPTRSTNVHGRRHLVFPCLHQEVYNSATKTTEFLEHLGHPTKLIRRPNSIY